MVRILTAKVKSKVGLVFKWLLVVRGVVVCFGIQMVRYSDPYCVVGCIVSCCLDRSKEEL